MSDFGKYPIDSCECQVQVMMPGHMQQVTILPWMKGGFSRAEQNLALGLVERIFSSVGPQMAKYS